MAQNRGEKGSEGLLVFNQPSRILQLGPLQKCREFLHAGRSSSVYVVGSVALVLFVVLATHASPGEHGLLSYVVPARNDARGYTATAVNLLETKFYPHHPVFRLVAQDTLKFEPDFLTEINDLRVPLGFDCENFGNANWGGYSYFRSNPSRWYACWLHHAALRSGMPGMVPPLPLIDEEYFEQVAVYDSVLRANGSFVFAELGARWGTWGARAAAYLRHVRKDDLIPYHILFVEERGVHCDGLRQVMQKNEIDHQLICGLATPAVFLDWAANHTHINVIDLDIQGAEAPFFADENVMAVVEKKVERLIIGTHSEEIHSDMRDKFAHWVLVHDMPMTKNASCITQFLRVAPASDRSNFERLIEYNCYFTSSYGRIPNADGELILDNPRFHQGQVLFPNPPLP